MARRNKSRKFEYFSPSHANKKNMPYTLKWSRFTLKEHESPVNEGHTVIQYARWGLVVPPMSFDIILKCHFLFGAIAPSSYNAVAHIIRCIAACCRHSIVGALHHPSSNMTQHQSANSTLYVAGIALTASWLATTVYLMRQNFSLRQCQQRALDDDDDDNRCSNKDKETDTLSSKTDSQFLSCTRLE